MKIWWCQELDEDFGMFVAANAPSKAKYLYSQEAECRYTDVRYHCVVKDADIDVEETLSDTKDMVLQRHGLHYLNEYREPIKNHDCVDTTLVTVKPVVEEEEFVYYGQVNYFGYDEPVFKKLKIKHTVDTPACKVCKCYLFDYNSDFVYCPYCGSFIKDKGEKFDGSMEGKS